jgi:hypothetical protein
MKRDIEKSQSRAQVSSETDASRASGGRDDRYSLCGRPVVVDYKVETGVAIECCFARVHHSSRIESETVTSA